MKLIISILSLILIGCVKDITTIPTKSRIKFECKSDEPMRFCKLTSENGKETCYRSSGNDSFMVTCDFYNDL